MSNETAAFEYHYQRCSAKAKEYLNNVVLPSAINFTSKHELTILYAGCGVAPAAIHLLNCLIAKGFVGQIKLILVDLNKKALDFAIKKLQQFHTDRLLLVLEVVRSELRHYANTTRDVFDIILFEHPLTDLIGSLAAPLLYKLLPGIMHYLLGEAGLGGNNYRHAITLLSKKIKPEGVVMGGCYTIIEHQQLKALLEMASEFKIMHSKIGRNSLFFLSFEEYGTSLLAKKVDTTALGKMPNEQLLSRIDKRDKLFLLSFLFCNALLFMVDKFSSLSETLRFAAVFMLGFYIQPIFHNYSGRDIINKTLIPLLEMMICFLPVMLHKSEAQRLNMR